MNSLKGIYDSSSFYREARIISFLDHLYMAIKKRLHTEFKVGNVILAYEDYFNFDEQLDYAQ